MPLPPVPERTPAARLNGSVPLFDHPRQLRCNQFFPEKTVPRGLSAVSLGKSQNMNDHVDWSAMSEEDFVALLRQLVESPEADDDQK